MAAQAQCRRKRGKRLYRISKTAFLELLQFGRAMEAIDFSRARRPAKAFSGQM
jgi:hypothetical protein